MLESPQHLPPKEATLCSVAEGCRDPYRASRKCSKRRFVLGFEPRIMFGTKLETIIFFCSQKWEELNSIPLQRFQMPLNVPRTGKPLKDQRILLAADNVLDHFRLAGICRSSADQREKYFDQVQNVLVDLGSARLAEVEEIEQLDLEPDPLPADHDVVIVNVAMIFAARVNRGDSLGQHVQHVQRFEGAEAMPGLPMQEFAELFPSTNSLMTTITFLLWT